MRTGGNSLTAVQEESVVTIFETAQKTGKNLYAAFYVRLKNHAWELTGGKAKEEACRTEENKICMTFSPRKKLQFFSRNDSRKNWLKRSVSAVFRRIYFTLIIQMQLENIYSQGHNRHHQNQANDRQKGKAYYSHGQGSSNQHHANGKF